jgi:hypothetical protein
MKTPNAHHRLRFVRFSLRGLIVAVLVIGGWMGWLVRSARVQRQAVAAIEQAGGHVYYDWERNDGRPIPNGKPLWPKWLVHSLGVDYFGNIDTIFLCDSGAGRNRDALESALAHVSHLRRLKFLCLDRSYVSEEGMKHLEGLTSLQKLSLNSADVGDAELAHVKALSGLRSLYIQGTRISDTGLRHLAGLTYLRRLSIGGTGVSDAGLVHIGKLTNLQFLSLVDVKITDVGLEHLKGLSGLNMLSLDQTRVTDAGTRRLQRVLPKAEIIGPGESPPR